MKKILLVSLFFFASLISAFSQVPDAFNYQAVVRNSSGEIIANQNVAFQISILQNSDTGTAVYVETHSATTNKFGLVSLEIGHGNVKSGVFDPGGWTADKHFIKVEFDPAGGNSFTQMGTSQLLAVPYAFQAKTVEIDNVDDADADPSNEIQTLDLSGTQLSLSKGGGTVTLPSSGGGDNWGTQTVKSDATLSGIGTTASPLSVVGDLTDDQSLSLSGSDLSISGGNTVTLPAGTGDNWGTQSVISDATLTGNGTTASPLSVVGDLTDDQSLSLSGSDLSISGGNTVTLPASPWTTNLYGIGYFDNVGIGGGFAQDIKFFVYTPLTTAMQVTASAGTGTNYAGKFITQSPDGYSGHFTGGKFYVSGNVGIGTEAPSSKLDVSGVIRATENVWPTTGAGVEIGYNATLGIGAIQSYDRNTATWKSLALGAIDVYPVTDNYTNLGITNHRWKTIFAVNGTIQTSDRRMKKDIHDLNYGLNTVLQLRPVSYRWKNGQGGLNIGLIAQEVQPLIPEVVDVGDDEIKTLGMKYTELIPVLINAIKEQQKIISSQNTKIDGLTAEVAQLKTMDQRLKSLEAALNIAQK